MTWHRVASVNDLPSDEMVIGVKLMGIPIAIYRMAGEYFATHNICTHQFAYLSEGFLEDGCIECPLHQARFDVRTGEVKDGPTDKSVATYRVKVVGEDLVIEISDAG